MTSLSLTGSEYIEQAISEDEFDFQIGRFGNVITCGDEGCARHIEFLVVDGCFEVEE